ncbi:ABC transporter permease [uncultured Ruminococcus sp.]|uniref:ABC transporter permease n=1 Tax=uncultured Ruminococcus sp. TaxID=165186 RepID=UPI000EDB2522|nr:ABC transporter permease [uncultured Ruminococcus sp.]HCJ41027.1 macrolide ABC transporter permease [Ruminococcus sp.]
MIENIRLSLQGILSHKIRSLLTMLGIIIGIAAIIAIVSTIEGTNEQIKNNLIGSGNNTVKITLTQGDAEPDFSWSGVPDNIRVISEESKKRITDLKEVERCTLYRTRQMPQNVFYMNKVLESSIIYGIDEDYFKTLGYEVAQGIGFSDKQYKDYSKVAIIDSNMQRGIFENEDPIGKTLDIAGEPFKIIGVVCKRSGFEPVINSVDDYYTYNQTSSGLIFIPTNDWGIVFRYDEPQNCVVQAKNTDSMTGAGKKTADILNENIQKQSMGGEKQSEGAVNALEYKSESLLEQAKKLQDLSKSTNSMLIWIAGISLLVGGIGVMNIMLVSVTERTREIGLKKALGARRSRILAQFLTEASVLTTIGGILGVLIGIGLSKVIAKIAEVPVSISTPAIIVSVGFSMVVGIVFGLIPSIKAANLNPIDALRYE